MSSSRFIPALAKSAAWAGFTLIDPNSLSGWRKHAYWLTMAGASAAETVRPLPGDGTYVDQSPEARFGVATAVAGLIYGGHELGAKADAWSIGIMRRAGLKHPRVWAAGAVFVSMLAASLAEHKLAERTEEEQPDGYDEFGRPLPETLEPLPQDVRAVIGLLLDTVDGYGSDELRAQLDDVVCREEMGSYALVADTQSPRTLLDSYTFPATALFTRDGVNHILMLDVEEGRLSYLSHLIEPYQEDETAVDWSLPPLDELDVVVGFEEADAISQLR